MRYAEIGVDNKMRKLKESRCTVEIIQEKEPIL
jgi:hypothetical protein